MLKGVITPTNGPKAFVIILLWGSVPKAFVVILLWSSEPKAFVIILASVE